MICVRNLAKSILEVSILSKNVEGKLTLMEAAVIELKNRLVELESLMTVTLCDEVDLDELLGGGHETAEQYMEHK